MKKLITLVLVLTGIVSTASATTLHIGMEPNHSGDVYVYRFGAEGADNWDSMGSSQKASFDKISYGRRWYTINMNNQPNAIVRWDTKQTVDINSISGDDYYIYVSTSQTGDKYNSAQLDNPYSWKTIKCGNNISNQWDDDAAACDKVNSYTFTRTFTKSDITTAQGNNYLGSSTEIRFRFKHTDGTYWRGEYDFGTHYPLIIPSESGTGVEIGDNTTSYLYGYNDDNDKKNNYWKITLPNYDYEKIVVTLEDVSKGNANWKISADAYVKKNITSELYATFGSGADVDFSKYEGPEGGVLTAQKGKVLSNGHISWTDATTLNHAEGALLHATVEGDYLISVASPEPGTDAANNDFIAIPLVATQITQTSEGKNRYILAHPTGKTLGFYTPANGNGSWCAAGTAYLETIYGPASTRDYFPLDDESASVESIMNETKNANLPVYDLQGRYVENPQKGLYIMDGRKVVIK